MKKETKHNIINIAGILLVLILAIFLVPTLETIMGCCQCGATPSSLSPYSSNCCPCPNSPYIEEVSEHFGYEPSSAGSWDDMCRLYKVQTNKSFDCFK